MVVTAKSLEEQLAKVRGLEDRLTFRLSVLSRLLDQQAQDMLEGADINLTSYRILNVVNTFEVISISDISRFCGIDRAQISRSAMSLAKRGLVKFQGDPVSKRKKNVSLTEAGQTLLEDLHPRFLARNLELDDVLGPERRAALTDAINILTEHVSQ
ncbi:MAG: MarR family transcriptional regulator [Pseudomonadota bacterium]